MVIRAKTKYLFDVFELSEEQKKNSELNLTEAENVVTRIKSAPRRLVLELTNACNLNCIMCGRNSADFKLTSFDLEWLKKFEPVLNKIEEVALFGWGEPTVHPKFVEFLNYLDRFNVRKYFCTNGMLLGRLKDDIFKYNVDIIAISVDGAKASTNDRIRRGAKLDKIVTNLKDIVAEKKAKNLDRPYMNFVFCAMQSNIHELPDLVKLASEIGLEEVKVVYLTAFSEDMMDEVLWNKQELVRKVFSEAEELSIRLGVKLKLPHIQGEDEANNLSHKTCYVGWRDLFLGSDSFIRPCMSTPMHFHSINDFNNLDELWNSDRYQNFRAVINEEDSMPASCAKCYQSSHCNWNQRHSFIQMGNDFAPEWEG